MPKGPRAADSTLSVGQRSLQRQIQDVSDRYRAAQMELEATIREQVLASLSDLRAQRDLLIRQAYSLGKDPAKGWRSGNGLSAASIKRAMRTKDHKTLIDIVGSIAAEFDFVRGPDFTVTDKRTDSGWPIILVHWYTLPTGEVVEHPSGGSEWVLETFTDALDPRKSATAVVEPEDANTHDEFTKRAVNWFRKSPETFAEWRTDLTNRVQAEIDKEEY